MIAPLACLSNLGAGWTGTDAVGSMAKLDHRQASGHELCRLQALAGV